MFGVGDIRREYMALDEKTGMDIAKTIPIEITKRCTERRGVYKYKIQKSTGIIKDEKIIISDFVMREERETFYNTIRHEYAHAMAVRIHRRLGLGHGKEWQECCKIVGCKPEATAQATEQQMAAINRRKKYIVTCNSCGHEWTYGKRNKIVKSAEMDDGTLTCPYCNGKSFSVRANQITVSK